jgi:hypothetical protein
MRRTTRCWRRSKKGLPRPPGGDRAGRGSRQAGRGLVRRRGEGRTEKTRSPAAGRSAAPGRGRPTTSARNGPTSSAPSVPPRARAPASSCPGATPRRCRPTSARSALRSRPAPNAVLLLDRAGWHLSGKLAVPSNITILPLPPRSPELNPGRKRLAVSSATTGSRTESSGATPTSSRTAATPETS